MFPQVPQNILIIPLRYIGDTILTVPFIRNLRHQFPAARIDLLTSKTSAPLMAVCPYLDQVLVEPKGILARLRLLREHRYDAVFMLRKSVSMSMLAKLAGVSTVVGYDKQRFPFGYKRWGCFLDIQARYPGLKTETPQAISHLGLLSACGIPVQDTYLELWSTEADEQQVLRLLEDHQIDANRPIAIFHAASASHGKQIEGMKFLESLRYLNEKGYQIVATGTPSDQPLYEKLQQQLTFPLNNLAGKTSLRETFALYKKSQLLLTVDSSPIHLGAAAGIPKIAGVFGPTNEKQWGPLNASVQFKPVFMDLPCRPCYAKICEHNQCRTLLTGEQIRAALQSLE